VKGWREWVAAMGSKTIDLDPARHDELVAWVSHLPQFVATALSALLQEEVGDAPELKDVGGRALREMTRLGASPYSMWRDIAYTNTEACRRRCCAGAAAGPPARKPAHAGAARRVRSLCGGC
jgi:prephenate dehydrogenase